MSYSAAATAVRRLRNSAPSPEAGADAVSLPARAGTFALRCDDVLYHWRDYLALCKPRVVSLVVFTAIVSMCLAAPHWPISWVTLVAGTVGVALAAGAAATLNQVADRDIDAKMRRTRGRPLPTHALSVRSALVFAAALTLAAMLVLVAAVNVATALLALVTVVGYSVVYTRWLKWSTPQNIVLGGAAGAAPALLGWTAATGTIAPPALALFLIVFVWTPAHFWPLAIARRHEYAAAGVPMLPVTHGIDHTLRRIFAYAVALLPVSLTPCIAGIGGPLYAIGALILGAEFIRRAYELMRHCSDRAALRLFRFSITYLGALFALMLADTWIRWLVDLAG